MESVPIHCGASVRKSLERIKDRFKAVNDLTSYLNLLIPWGDDEVIEKVKKDKTQEGIIKKGQRTDVITWRLQHPVRCDGCAV